MLPEGVRFHADIGGQTYQRDVEAHITRTNEAFLEFFGVEVVEATIFIHGDLDNQRNDVSSFLGVDPAHLNFGPGAQAWPKSVGLLTELIGADENLIIHELFHVLQHQLAHPDGGLLPLTPAWMSEGGAEYASDTVRRRLNRHGNPTYDRGSGCRGLDERLEDLERQGREGRGQVYCHGFNAVRMLAEEHGDEALLEFWESQGKGEPWRAAFQDTFGQPVDEFYDAFDEWNLSGGGWPDWFEWRPGDPVTGNGEEADE